MADESSIVQSKDSLTAERNVDSVAMKQEAPDESDVKLESELILQDDIEVKSSLIGNSMVLLSGAHNSEECIEPKPTVRSIGIECRPCTQDVSVQTEPINLSEMSLDGSMLHRMDPSSTGAMTSPNGTASKPEANKKQSLPTLNGTTSRTTLLDKTVKVVLSRCDSEERSRLKSKETSASRVIKQTCFDAPTKCVKVENESEPVDSVTSESDSSGANVSVQTGVSNGKQSDYSAFVKMEEDKGPLTRELVGQFPRSQGSSGYARKPLLRIIKLEECNTHSNLDSHLSVEKANNDVLNKMSQAFSQKNKLLVTNEFLLVGTAKTPSPGEDATIKTGVSQPLVDCLQSNAIVKIEEEEEEEEDDDANRTVVENLSENGLRPNGLAKIEELVGSLPENGDQREHDAKCALKAVQFRESEAGVESGPLFGTHSTIGPTKAHCSKTCSTVSQPKKKVLCDVNPKKKVDGKQFACSECSYRCSYRSRLITHLRVHSGERPFECNDCLMKFKRKSQLNQHRIIHTSKKPFECKNCAAKFKSKSNLVGHMSTHSDKRQYSCSLCPAKLKRNEDLTCHSMTHTTERRFVCAHCSRKFKNKKGLRVHMKIHLSSGERLYTCEHCSAKFRHKYVLASHLQVHSCEKPYSCPHCPMTFKGSSNLKSHLRLHTGEMPYSCQQCPAKFRHSSSLKIHLTTHSNEKPFSCDQCPRNFKLKCHLKRHKETHETKRLCCAHCSNEFKTLQALKEHMKRVHTDIGNWHACNQCLYKTYHKSNLKKHMLVHSNDRPFSCDQCLKKFKTAQKLKLHALVHKNDKSFSCDKCSATFKYKNNLQVHLKRHSVGNRYACTLCPFATPFAHCLKIHSSVHTGGRKYSCEHCPGKFNAKGDLKRHLVVHTREKPYQCPHCSSKFTLKYNLLNHLKKNLQEKVLSK